MITVHDGGAGERPASLRIPPPGPDDPDRPPPAAAAIDVWAVSEDEGQAVPVVRFVNIHPDHRDQTLTVAIGVARVTAAARVRLPAFRGGDVRVCDDRGAVLHRERIPAAA